MSVEVIGMGIIHSKGTVGGGAASPVTMMQR